MEKNNTAQYTVEITKLPGSMVEIKGELQWDAFEKFEKESFKHLSSHLEIDGFRKGNVPTDMAKKHIGDEIILTDMAERAMQ